MQLIPRYLYPNRIDVILDIAGESTEYRPVYSRTLKIYKGYDNVVQFRILNSDQKPQAVSEPVVLKAFDSSNRLVFEYTGTQVMFDDSTVRPGLFSFTILAEDLELVQDQYLSYSVLVDHSTLTYSSSHFENDGIMQVMTGASVRPLPSTVVSFSDAYYADHKWFTSTVSPTNNTTTVVIDTDGHIGEIEIQATLDPMTGGQYEAVWSVLSTLVLTGDETEPVLVNLTGVYSWIRFVAHDEPTSDITITVR